MGISHFNYSLGSAHRDRILREMNEQQARMAEEMAKGTPQPFNQPAHVKRSEAMKKYWAERKAREAEAADVVFKQIFG